ncbi:MAG TPA: porin [Candidatus Limnocylindrales bacterium]|nr:porin [Candidatus Limnocylindrales bacterium]
MQSKWIPLAVPVVLWITSLLVLAAEEPKPTINIFPNQAVKLTIGGYAHFQFSTSSVEDQVDSSFEVRRARLTADAVLSDWLSGRIMIDAASSTDILRDAYLLLNFDPRFNIRIGQYKRPFFLLEILSATTHLPIERGVRIRGLGRTALFDLLDILNYTNRDIGVQFEGKFESSTPIRYALSITNGGPANRLDTDNGKELIARVVVSPLKKFDVGFAFANNNYEGVPIASNPLPPTESANAQAFGIDFLYEQGKTKGLYVQADLDVADNYQGPKVGNTNVFLTQDVPTLFGFQVNAGYRFELHNRWMSFIEPLFRFDYADPNRDKDDDASYLITPGVNLYLQKSVRLMFNYDIVSFQSEAQETESAFRFQAQFVF